MHLSSRLTKSHHRSQTQLEYLNLRDDALEGVSASPEKLSLFNALVEAATAGSSLKHVDLSGEWALSTYLLLSTRILTDDIRALFPVIPLQATTSTPRRPSSCPARCSTCPSWPRCTWTTARSAPRARATWPGLSRSSPTCALCPSAPARSPPRGPTCWPGTLRVLLF